jgi:hypothetical protein
MGKSAVVGAGEHEVAHAQLLDSSESLELFGVDEIEQQPVASRVLEGNDVVDGVANNLGPTLAHGSYPATDERALRWIRGHACHQSGRSFDNAKSTERITYTFVQFI